MFYVSVGSDSSDRTGVYRISISARNLQESNNQRRRSAPREEPQKTRLDQPDGENYSKKSIEPEKLNSPASGVQAIIGTAQVGEVLSAGISLADGMRNADSTHRWLPGDANITDATASTYTLADVHAGKPMKLIHPSPTTRATPSLLPARPPPRSGLRARPTARLPARRPSRPENR